MLEFPNQDVAVHEAVIMCGQRWQCLHLGRNIVFVFLHRSGISASLYVTTLQ